jgi:folate-dependent phosphoribosylglycinamide formyltransferase PurN
MTEGKSGREHSKKKFRITLLPSLFEVEKQTGRQRRTCMPKPIYDSTKGKMRVAALVSGSGSSFRTVIEQQIGMESIGLCPYEVVGILTDNPKSKTFELGKEFNVPVFLNDIRAYYEKRGKKITDKQVREEYDKETVRLFEPVKPDFLAYAGYVWATTSPLVNAYISVNAHPADLSIEKDGRRAYAGANGVRDALMGGENEVRSTLHLVTTQVDGGPILLISDPVTVDKNAGMSLEEASRVYLRALNDKTRKLFPRVVKDIAEGTYRRDEEGLLYYGDVPIPKGYRL